MSFIYNDKNFMNLVVNFNKKAQDAAPALDEKVKTVQNILDKVFERLKGTNLNAVKFQKMDKFIADLAPTNMVNLDSFLFYLSKEKSEYQGKLIATKEMQGYKGTSPPGYVFYKNEYRVNVAGLKGTLDYLKKSETYEKNSLFKTMLDALYSTAESQIKGFKDAVSVETEIIAEFKKEIDLTQRINVNKGDIALLSADLKNPQSLDKWIGYNKLTIKEGNKDITNDQDVICKFAQYLYINVPSNFRSTCESLIKQISGCRIPDAGTGAGTGAAGQTIGGTTVTEDAANKQDAKNILIEIFRRDGPMYRDQIKFDEITKFLSALKVISPQRSSLIDSDLAIFRDFSNRIGGDVFYCINPNSVDVLFNPSNAEKIREGLAFDRAKGVSNVQIRELILRLKDSVSKMNGHIYEAANFVYAGNEPMRNAKCNDQNRKIGYNDNQLSFMVDRIMHPLK